MVFPAIKAPLLRRILMRIFAVLPGFCAVKKNVFMISFLHFEGQIFAYFRSFIFLQADGFPSNRSSSAPSDFDAYFCSFARFFAVKKTYFWSDFCILKVKFLHISDLLFSYKQMVFPAIKAPLLRRILMRIFAVLPGFLLWKKRIFDQISVFWRSNFCIFQIFYFLTSRWFSQQLKLLCSVGFWWVFSQFCQVFCCEKIRIFDQISVFGRSNFCIYQIFYFLTSRWFSQQLKLLCSVEFWCVFLQFCQFFCCEKKTYFWSDFCILKVKFLHISDLLFSYKQMVFPAIKAPLFRRILMRIFAVLPGFFSFAVKNYRIFDQIIVFWKSNFCIIHIFWFHFVSIVLHFFRNMGVPF